MPSSRLRGEDLAGVREALDAHQWSVAEQESPIIGAVLEAESQAIEAEPPDWRR